MAQSNKHLTLKLEQTFDFKNSRPRRLARNNPKKCPLKIKQRHILDPVLQQIMFVVESLSSVIKKNRMSMLLKNGNNSYYTATFGGMLEISNQPRKSYCLALSTYLTISQNAIRLPVSTESRSQFSAGSTHVKVRMNMTEHKISTKAV